MMAADAITTPKIDMSTFVPLTSSSTSVATGPSPAASMPDDAMITRMANVYDLDPDVIRKQIQQESGGNPKAVSKKGAQGVMQLMPDTSAALGVKDPFDPVQNIDGGMRLMSRLLGKYNGDYSKALAAYNSGEPNVDKAGGIPDIDETRNYVNSILKGTKYEVKPQESARPSAPKVDMSTFVPISQPSTAAPSTYEGSVTNRYLTGLNQSMGLPNDIRDVPKMLEDLTTGPIPNEIAGQSFPGAAVLNTAINMAKGTIKSSMAASGEGAERFTKGDRVGGALRYIIGGVPLIGPSIVKSMDSMEKGDYAGALGTASGLGLQALIANPETTSAHLDAAGKYLFSKPRVQETMLSGETKEMLTAAELAARKRVISMAPKYDDLPPVPGSAVNSIAEKALNENIHGITATPKPISDILQENPAKFKRIGAMETPGGDLMDIFTRMSSNQPTSMADLHDYYTKLGEYGSKDLPGNVYKAVKETRDGIGKLIDGQYKIAEPDPTTGLNRSDQWEDFRKAFSDMHTHWWDNDSPLYQSMHAQDPAAILKPLTGDSAERAADYLGRYQKDGADPLAVKAAANFYKGLNQMQLRGLLQASGGLLLSYMLRSEGAGAQVGAAAAGALLSRRLVSGYFKTRPSITALLAEAAEKPSLGRQLPPMDISKLGNPSPFSPSGGPREPAPIAPLPVDHSSSTITPTEGQFISSIADKVDHPDLKADLQAISKEVMAQTPSTSRGTPTGEARIFEGRSGQLPAELHADLEKQAGRALSTDEAIALDRANLERQMGLGGVDESSAIREAHRAKLEMKGRSVESAMTVNPSTAVNVSLPHDLAGSKPKYGYRDKLFDLQFPDDITKALYTVAQTTENKAHGRFMAYLRQAFPGKSDVAIIAKGKEVKASIKPIATSGDPEQGPLMVPAAGSIR